MSGDGVEWAVVDPRRAGWGEAPQPLIGQVSDPGAELVAQQPEQAEHQVGVGGGVGRDQLRLRAAVAAEDDVQNVQGVAHRAGDHDGADASHLVVDRVEPGDTPAVAEVARVRPGVQGADRDDEPQPVHARDQAAAPQLRDLDPGLSLD